MESNYYLDFENKFRGKRQDIIDTLSIYDQLVEIIVENNPSPKLIDIGCGRGEWLQKWTNKFSDITGIESDKKMVKTCIDNNLNVIEGDAIEVLTMFKNQSVNVITMFHLIEHLTHEKLVKLLIQCQRVLSDDGVLIMETPNIDSLLVATKSFQIDPTHINPIHPDLIAFDLNNVGFTNVKTYNIHCGPLRNASPIKITRVLNGVAQDLCIVATKQQRTFQMLMVQKSIWENHFDAGLTTLQAAVEYDLQLENLLKVFQNQLNSDDKADKLNILENEIYLLKSQLKLLIYFSNIIKKVLKPILNILRFSRKLIIILFNNLFNSLVRFRRIRYLLISKKFLRIINFLLRLIKGPSSIDAIQIQNKFNKLLDRDTKFILQNKKLLLHHRLSINSQLYRKLFTKRK